VFPFTSALLGFISALAALQRASTKLHRLLNDEVSGLTSARVGNAFFFWQRTLSHNSTGAVFLGGALPPETCRNLVNGALLA
jgi:hypothetical protein